MEAIEAILSEVDKLQPDEKRQLLHQLVDRIMAIPSPEVNTQTNFDKYIGIGKGVWVTDAQTYIDEQRNDERF
jgi:hypothetical protein